MQGKLETRVGLFVLAAIAVFIYMGFQIGSFRFDLGNYNPYVAYFHDVSGLSRKALVKIAGVDVGWVDALSIVPDGSDRVKARLMILKEYALYDDANAVVRQEGFLGPRYVELIPGSPESSRLRAGGVLGQPNKSPVKVDELLRSFEGIAQDVQDVSGSFRQSFGGDIGKERVEVLVKNVSDTAQRMSDLSETLERTVTNNEDKIESFLDIGNQVKRVTDRLDETTLPSFEQGIDKVTSAIDIDLERVSDRFEASTYSFEKASGEVTDSFRSIGEIADKINRGQGLIGRLVNEDELYTDIHYAASSLRGYFSKAQQIRVIFDGHTENMHRPAENFGKRNDSKAYLDVRIYPAEDYFFLLQLAASERGFYDRYQIQQGYWDENGCLVDVNNLNLTDAERLDLTFTKNFQIVQRQQWRIGVQLGKSFGPVRFRIGLFDGYGGVGADCDIPLPNRKARWITTFEAFDFNGWNRNNDWRPHFKWINRVFAMQNVYFAFGTDDFVSKKNANIFAGVGMRFGDDDIKHLLPVIASSGPALVSQHNDGMVKAVIIND